MAKQFEILDENERLIAGWASVEIVDSHGDIVPIDELRRGMYKLMDRGGYILYGHSNKPVGKILGWEIRKHEDVDADGLWIIAKIYKEYPLDNEVWRLVKDGQLRGFSIGAQGKKEKMYLKDKSKNLPQEISVIRDLNLMEISLVPTPANPLATIEEVNYIAKSLDGGKDVGVLNLDEVLRKYKISKELYDGLADCSLCFELSKIIKDVGDVDVGVRVWRAISLERDRKVGLLKNLDESFEKIHKGIMELKEFERKLNEARAAEVEDMSAPLDSIFSNLAEIWKTIVEIQKPFGKWSSFDDCVSDMKSKGYDEEASKRICGSLQAKLEEKGDSLDAILEKYQSTLRDFGFPAFPRGGWPRRKRSRGRQTKIEEYVKSNEFLKAAIECLDYACEILDSAGDDYVPLLAVVDSVYGLAKAVDENRDIVKDKRPPKEWFYRCVDRTGRPALCGWVFYHHLYPKKPESKKEPDKPYTAEARARKRAITGG